MFVASSYLSMFQIQNNYDKRTTNNYFSSITTKRHFCFVTNWKKRELKHNLKLWFQFYTFILSRITLDKHYLFRGDCWKHAIPKMNYVDACIIQIYLVCPLAPTHIFFPKIYVNQNVSLKDKIRDDFFSLRWKIFLPSLSLWTFSGFISFVSLNRCVKRFIQLHLDIFMGPLFFTSCIS